MPKYYSLMLSQNISKTVHGYLICENALLCRSGYQEYKGSELVGFPGYEESWGLEPETRYNIYRPKESVLDTDFIKSIEGCTVVDEHPDGSVVHVDNDRELNCGHVEKVGKGPDIDGEVTLKGDIFIKNPELIEKVRPENNPDDPNAVRDISLGYSLRLKRLEDGTIIMTHLRGNHCAIVEKGRAGPLIAIKDSALPKEEPKPKIIKKENTMSWTDRIFGIGFKQFAVDASPEDIMAASKELGKPAEGSAIKEDPHAAHMGACKEYCEKGGDLAALMAFLKGEKPAHDANDDESLEELEDETGNSGKGDKTSGEEEQDEKTGAEEGDKMATDFGEVDQQGESVLKQANDSMRGFIKSSKPLIAAIVNKPKAKRSKFEQTMVDNYNGAVKAINKAGGKAYAPLVQPKKLPEVLVDSNSSVTKEDDLSCGCFDGVPYRVGIKRHESCPKKGNK